ncbi:hypothetical protein DRP07_00805 [Archaeoglobales archaeon]|nr:MAG: hypothetical protein DRP07_00805 [Archaeoglobales archaeon]
MLELNINYIIFFIVTFAVILFVERLEERVLNSGFFKSYTKEMEKVERELNEYYFYSVLAIALKDKEAYEGYQSLMSEKYWPFFFRKIMLNTSLYFLLLTPYMVFAHYALSDIIQNAFSWVLFLAIFYFTARLGFGFIKDAVDAWKEAKKAEKRLENLSEQC